MTADNGTNFRFGYDSENDKYGYYVTDSEGADTLIPFKSGGGVYYLGTARSYNISDIVGANNIGNYKKDNFIVVIQGTTKSNVLSGGEGIVRDSTATMTITTASVSYNTTTGAVKISGGTWKLSNNQKWGTETTNGDLSVKVYFVDSNIQ